MKLRKSKELYKYTLKSTFGAHERLISKTFECCKVAAEKMHMNFQEGHLKKHKKNRKQHQVFIY